MKHCVQILLRYWQHLPGFHIPFASCIIIFSNKPFSKCFQSHESYMERLESQFWFYIQKISHQVLTQLCDWLNIRVTRYVIHTLVPSFSCQFLTERENLARTVLQVWKLLFLLGIFRLYSYSSSHPWSTHLFRKYFIFWSIYLFHEVLHLFHKVLHWIHELFDIWKSRKVSKGLEKSRKISENFNSRSFTKKPFKSRFKNWFIFWTAISVALVVLEVLILLYSALLRLQSIAEPHNHWISYYIHALAHFTSSGLRLKAFSVLLE